MTPTTPTRDRPTLGADIALLAVAIVWGGSYLAAQVMTGVASPLTVLALRFLPSAVVLVAICVARRAVFTRRTIGVGVIMGVFQAVTLTLETYAVTRTSAANAGVLVSLAVVIAPALEGVVSRSRLPGAYYLAAGLSVAGVAMLIGPGGLTKPNLGDLFVLLAACTRAGLMVLSGHLTRGAHDDAARAAMNPLAVNTVQTIFNAVIFTAVSAGGVTHAITHLDAKHWLVMAFLSLGCTCAAFLLQLWAIHHTSATRASLILGTEPIWALAAGVALAGDHLGTLGLAGAAAIIAATWWGQRIEARWRATLLAPVNPPAAYADSAV